MMSVGATRRGGRRREVIRLIRGASPPAGTECLEFVELTGSIQSALRSQLWSGTRRVTGQRVGLRSVCGDEGGVYDAEKHREGGSRFVPLFLDEWRGVLWALGGRRGDARQTVTSFCHANRRNVHTAPVLPVFWPTCKIRIESLCFAFLSVLTLACTQPDPCCMTQDFSVHRWFRTHYMINCESTDRRNIHGQAQ